MITIRKEQKKALSSYSRTTFIGRMRDYLLETNTAGCEKIGLDHLEQTLDEIIEICSSYEIRMQRNIAEFAGFCVSHRVGFEENPEHSEALRILMDSKMAEGTKLLQLRTYFSSNAEAGI
ncbi:MAG TPA: hypothetical protein DCE52_05835 [Rhodobacteraceae bacterium]|nr:hypothetical protein [Paracoccaceae bacterium]